MITQSTHPLVSVLVDAVLDRSARGLASAVNRLIGDGTLAAGVQLPTVRTLAKALGVSPSTVSEAWQALGEAGAIDARGRQGTVVVGKAMQPRPSRYRKVTGGQFSLDFSTGTPDPLLLPDVRSVLGDISRSALTTSYLDDPVYPPLAEQLREAWPFPAEEITVVDGCMDALDRLASSILRLGDRVLVENPTFPPLLDLLEQRGVEVIGLALDDHGIVPQSLLDGLTRDPAVLFTQPRAHNPTGISATGRRVAELARMLRNTSILVIEDDHANDISSSPLASFGVHLPDRTIHIRGFSKSHGPDLRLAAVGGAGEPILRMIQRRILGPGWSSRLLQAVLAELLRSSSARDHVVSARHEYALRRTQMAAALSDRDVSFLGADGINMWISVVDERDAQVGLAARGIGVAPGSPFCIGVPGGHHIRLTVGLVRDGHEAIADAVALVSGMNDRPFGGRSR